MTLAVSSQSIALAVPLPVMLTNTSQGGLLFFQPSSTFSSSMKPPRTAYFHHSTRVRLSLSCAPPALWTYVILASNVLTSVHRHVPSPTPPPPHTHTTTKPSGWKPWIISLCSPLPAENWRTEMVIELNPHLGWGLNIPKERKERIDGFMTNS